ncbi:hypothetical protein FRN29_21675 [Vibrio alginolyticus]|nr:hypothetical protein [Vibrio alginolyticus]
MMKRLSLAFQHIAKITAYRLFSFVSQTANAQLRGEQRFPLNLKHCAINTKFEVEAKVPSVVNPS